MASSENKLLEVSDLWVEFSTDQGSVGAVNGASFSLEQGKSLGIVGESGSGKSVTAQAILGIIDSPPGRIKGGKVLYRGQDLLQLDAAEMRKIRGRKISIVFQDALTSLNPRLRVGYQLMEAALICDSSMRRSDARERAIQLLRRVQVPSPEARLNAYPHELSGGMRQRVLIAMGLISGPELLIADEPTTALDVSVQAEIIELITNLVQESGLSVILISHNLAVVANIVDEIAVMYAGEIVEVGPVADVLSAPAHPYTRALLQSLPTIDRPKATLKAIRGSVPDLQSLPVGCIFASRCDFAVSQCVAEKPMLNRLGRRRGSKCHFSPEVLDERSG